MPRAPCARVIFLLDTTTDDVTTTGEVLVTTHLLNNWFCTAWINVCVNWLSIIIWQNRKRDSVRHPSFLILVGDHELSMHRNATARHRFAKPLEWKKFKKIAKLCWQIKNACYNKGVINKNECSTMNGGNYYVSYFRKNKYWIGSCFTSYIRFYSRKRGYQIWTVCQDGHCRKLPQI